MFQQHLKMVQLRRQFQVLESTLHSGSRSGTVTFLQNLNSLELPSCIDGFAKDVKMEPKASPTYTNCPSITKFVDKEGKKIPGYPTVDGEEPKLKFQDYRFVEIERNCLMVILNASMKSYDFICRRKWGLNPRPTQQRDGGNRREDIPGCQWTVVDRWKYTTYLQEDCITNSMPDPSSDADHSHSLFPQPQPTPDHNLLPQPKPEETSDSCRSRDERRSEVYCYKILHSFQTQEQKNLLLPILQSLRFIGLAIIRICKNAKKKTKLTCG